MKYAKYILLIGLILISFNLISSSIDFRDGIKKSGEGVFIGKDEEKIRDVYQYEGNLTNFTSLEDTPMTYSGSGGKCVAVNLAGSQLEFVECVNSESDTLQSVTERGSTTNQNVFIGDADTNINISTWTGNFSKFSPGSTIDFPTLNPYADDISSLEATDKKIIDLGRAGALISDVSSGDKPGISFIYTNDSVSENYVLGINNLEYDYFDSRFEFDDDVKVGGEIKGDALDIAGEAKADYFNAIYNVTAPDFYGNLNWSYIKNAPTIDWLSTYNETYDLTNENWNSNYSVYSKYWYNQTEPAINYVDSQDFIEGSILAENVNVTDEGEFYENNNTEDVLQEIGGQLGVSTTDISTTWKSPVLDKDLNSPPATPSDGDRYIVSPSADWYSFEWDKRIPLTIQSANVAEDETDALVQVQINGANDLFTEAQDDGDDIIFADSSGSEQLDHRIERFDKSNNVLSAYVKIPSLSSSSDETFYLYFNNTDAVNSEAGTDVFTSDYIMFYDFNETEGGIDKTQSANDYTSEVGSPSANNGNKGYGTSFDGDDDAWNMANLNIWESQWNEQDSGSERTHNIVFNSGSDITSRQTIFAEGGGVNGVLLYIYQGDLYARWWSESQGWSGNNFNTGISTNTDYYVTLTYDSDGDYGFYVNGAEIGNAITPEYMNAHSGDGGIGYTHSSKDFHDGNTAGAYFEGTIYELGVVADPWNENQHDTWYSNREDSLISKGTVESPGGATGAWSGLENYIVEYNATSGNWLSSGNDDYGEPSIGWAVVVEDESVGYTFGGSVWNTLVSNINHNTLSNLQGGNEELDQFFHLTENQKAKATRLATDTLSGLMPPGVTNQISSNTGLRNAIAGLSDNNILFVDSSVSENIGEDNSFFYEEATSTLNVDDIEATNDVCIDGGNCLSTASSGVNATIINGTVVNLVDTGSFVIENTGTKTVAGIPFEPDRVTFTAVAPVENEDVDDEGTQNANNVDNYGGTMHGYAKWTGTTLEQGVVHSGGSGNSINAVSEYGNTSECIGIRYADQNGDVIGYIKGSLTNFTSSGFNINVTHADSDIVVHYTAYHGSNDTLSNNWEVSGNTLHPDNLDYNIGIGTNNSIAKLSVNGSIRSSGSISFTSSLNDKINFAGDGEIYDSGTAMVIDNNQGLKVYDDTQSVFKTYISETVINPLGLDMDIQFESNIDEYAFFLRGNDGNIGIGTDNPSQELHVEGDTNVTGTLYYGAMESNSPHAFLEDETGHTRVCKKATDGTVVYETIEFNNGIGEYTTKINKDTNGVCDKVLIKESKNEQELMTVNGIPTYINIETKTMEDIWTKETSEEIIKEIKNELEEYEINKKYFVNDTFQYEGKAYKVIQEHTSQSDWKPDTTDSLYTELILYEFGEISEWVQPEGSHDAYPLGAKVTHDGFTWKNEVKDNVWEPGVYGWNKI